MNQYSYPQQSRQSQVPFQLGPKGQIPIQSLQFQTPTKSALETMAVDLDSSLTHLFDFREVYHAVGGPQLGGHPYLATHLPFARNDLPALDNSPLSDFTDTPQTLYRSSPMTEYADEDLAVPSDDDEDSEESAIRRQSRSHDAKDLVVPAVSISAVTPIPFSSPSGTSPTTYTLGDLGRSTQTVNEGQMRSFKQRLQNDIKTTALFPASSPSPPRAPVAMPEVKFDVTPIRSAPISIPSRKPSLHLVQPAEPINPFQRIVRPAMPAFTPFQAPVISDVHLLRTHREKPAQPTVALKDLMVADAPFWGEYNPDVLTAELSSPMGISIPLEMDTEYADEVEVVESPRGRSTSVTAKPQRVSSITTRSGVKRRAPSPHDSDEEDTDDEDEDAEGEDDAEDDDEYKAPASVRLPDPPTKRARLSTPTNPEPVVSSRPRVPYQSVTKPRTRHLQPNLVRTHGCRYGCDLLFSTAYESRRHQEDAHGREEAYALVATPNGAAVCPTHFRYLIQIALHANVDKWDTRTKTGLQTALDKRPEESLDEHLASTMIKWAKEWVRRYECPRCGTSFSRLDSRKRHFEKQCR